MKKVIPFILTAALAAGLCACGSQTAPGAGSAGGGSSAASTQTSSTQTSSAQSSSTQSSSGADAGTAAAASASSAGTEDAENFKAGLEKAAAYVESLIDISEMTESTEEEDPSYLSISWDNTANEVSSALDPEVLIDEKKVVIGKTTVKELEDLGFTVKKDSDTVGPNEVVGVSLTKDDKTTSLTLKENDTSDTVQIADLPVYSFTSGSSEFCLPFDYSGLTDESTVEDVINALGEPNSTIRVSSEAMGTMITLTYDEVKEDGKLYVLEIAFQYDPETNTESFFNILFSCN